MRIGVEVIIGAGLITANDGVVELERSCNVFIRLARLAHRVINGFVLANGGLVCVAHRIFEVGALRRFFDLFVLESGVRALVVVGVVAVGLSSSHELAEGLGFCGGET